MGIATGKRLLLIKNHACLYVGLYAGLYAVTSAALGAAPNSERVILKNFAIDRTEVTIAQFRSFAKATGTVTAAERNGGGFEWGSGWERRKGWTVYQTYGRKPETETEPAVHISWTEALGYCQWAGGRLPTAAEWRLAAYTETRAPAPDGFETGKTYSFPVGNDPAGMNTSDNDPKHDAWPRQAPVGTTKRGVNGLYDMGANVWEWLADRRAGEALTAGGSWWYGPDKTRTDGMQHKPADFYAVYVGFRCAYDIK